MDKPPVYPPRYTLRNILQFDDADLAANRQGFLSPRQRQLYLRPRNPWGRFVNGLFQIEKYKGDVLVVRGVVRLYSAGQNFVLHVGKFERFHIPHDEYYAFANEDAVGKYYAIYYHPITYNLLSAEAVEPE